MAIESELLCGSCFLEGPHVGHRSQLYLPLKLTHHARIDFGAFLTELDSFQTTFLDKPFDQMKTAIKTLFAPMKRFELESVHLSTVLDYNSLLESCGQKQDAVRLLLLDFSTKMAEYITQIKDVSESWNKSARSLDSERVPERREDREEEESRLDEEQENGEREHEDGEGEGERENEKEKKDEREEEEKEGQSEEELDSQPEEEGLSFVHSVDLARTLSRDCITKFEIKRDIRLFSEQNMVIDLRPCLILCHLNLHV